MPEWSNIIEQLHAHTGKDFIAESAQMVMGGDINRSYSLESRKQEKIFIKFNEKNKLAMFNAEAQGLAALENSGTVRVPKVLFYGDNHAESFLVLEYLHLSKARNEEALGQQLAQLHQHTQTEFGWQTNNTIGVTPQINTLNPSWIDFWITNRLRPQLNIAKRNNCGIHLSKLGEQLIEKCPALFSNHKPQASLLHGDLWGGNSAGLEDGTPVIFDPAVYYGDREVDLSMMELFGGYNKVCYDAYNEAFPVEDGYGLRKLFYNLYHILNHFNLFGSGYHQQSVNIMEKLLAEI